jgi:hypothetical protein
LFFGRIRPAAGPGYPLQFLDPEKGACAILATPFRGLRYFRFYPLRCSKMASLPFLSSKFFAKQKTYETIAAGIPAATLRRTKTLKRFGSPSVAPPFGRNPASMRPFAVR